MWYLILLIFPIGYVFGSIRSYSNTKKIINLKDHIKSIVLRTIDLFKVILGQPIISVYTSIVDKDYYRLSTSQMEEALIYVHDLMNSSGWSASDYIPEVKDCDDYADKMRVELKEFLLNKYKEEMGSLAIGIGVIGYLINGDPERAHASLKVLMKNNKVAYYNIYPLPIWRTPMNLSQKELDSVFKINI